MDALGAATGRKVTGEVVVRDKDGNLLVAFKSVDAESSVGQRFEAARIKYCMAKRGERIPLFLRTGKCPLPLKLLLTPILKRKLRR